MDLDPCISSICTLAVLSDRLNQAVPHSFLCYPNPSKIAGASLEQESDEPGGCSFLCELAAQNPLH